MVQKDLSEFYQTIQTDTAHVVADTATKVQDQIKVSFVVLIYINLKSMKNDIKQCNATVQNIFITIEYKAIHCTAIQFNTMQYYII